MRKSVPPFRSIRSISTRLDPGGTTSLPSQPKLQARRCTGDDLAEGAASVAAADAFDEVESPGCDSAVASVPIQSRIFSGSVRKANTAAAALRCGSPAGRQALHSSQGLHVCWYDGRERGFSTSADNSSNAAGRSAAPIPHETISTGERQPSPERLVTKDRLARMIDDMQLSSTLAWSSTRLAPRRTPTGSWPSSPPAR